MKTAIIYYSRHHGNTKKLVDAIAQDHEVTLIDAVAQKETDLTPYDRIGFASGIYFGKFHESVLKFAEKNLPEGKQVFFLCTYGGKGNTKAITEAVRAKSSVILGEFGCHGFDTYGPFKLIGGICKGHPDARDLEDACRFFEGLDGGAV
ncbi:MAG: flavodoxin [Oscillibacter sp.]|nr:flavodoxin [Oscillibacter sp.]